MDNSIFTYSIVALFGVFLSSLSQVLLKKATLIKYDSLIKEYLNPLVIIAYALFIITTFIAIYAYKVIPLSLGPILEATSYIYITIFGVYIFSEKINKRKLIANLCIIAGIVIYALFG